MTKIKNIDELIDLVQNLYDEEKIDWKPYCNIRNGLIDLKTYEELITKLEKRVKYLEGKQFYNSIFKQGYEKAQKEFFEKVCNKIDEDYKLTFTSESDKIKDIMRELL